MPADFSRAFALSTALNLAFDLVAAGYGITSHRHEQGSCWPGKARESEP
jgi:hypothetical protein